MVPSKSAGRQDLAQVAVCVRRPMYREGLGGKLRMLMVQHCFWSCTGIFLRAKALSPSSVQKNPWSLLGTDRSSKDGFRSALFDVAKSIPVVLDANWLAISKCFKDRIHTFLSFIFHPTWDDDPNSLTFFGIHTTNQTCWPEIKTLSLCRHCNYL